MQTELTVANLGGGAQFSVSYAKPGTRVAFPFVSTPIQNLVFSGSADFVSAAYDDPLIGGDSRVTATRMIDRDVVLTYKGDTTLRTVQGRLLQVGEEFVIDTGTDVVMIKTASAVSLTAAGLVGQPQLQLQLRNPDGDLTVRGVNGQFSFSATHSLLLEPVSESTMGFCRATLYSSATVFSSLSVPLKVDKLAFAEHEQQPVKAYEKTSIVSMAAAQAEPPSGGSSEQVGTMSLPNPVLLARTFSPTVVSLGSQKFDDARCYLLGVLDPTADARDKHDVSLEFVVRLGRDKKSGFLLSGPVTVMVDMDPAPGDDHVAPVTLPLGFYHNAWDADNAYRMHHKMGETMLLTADVCNATVPEEHNKKDNEHVVWRDLKLRNKTPYALQCKLYLRSQDRRRTLRDVRIGTGVPGVVRGFVPEQQDDVNEPDTRTLSLLVPARAEDFVVQMRVAYYVAT